MSTPDRIDQIRARAEAATEGPWTARRGYPNPVFQGTRPEDGLISASLAEHPDEDAEFVAHARTDVPWLLDRLAAVLALHSERHGIDANGAPYGYGECRECDEVWPCPTARAATGEQP